MLVTVDTNVLYQALRNKDGASHFILNLVAERKIRLAISVPVYEEYRDVLLRNKSLKDLSLNRADILSVLEFIAYIGIPVTIYYSFRPNLKDESDNIFVELSIASGSDYLITSNIKDYTRDNDLKFNDLRVVTPAEFVKLWRKRNEK